MDAYLEGLSEADLKFEIEKAENYLKQHETDIPSYIKLLSLYSTTAHMPKGRMCLDQMLDTFEGQTPEQKTCAQGMKVVDSAVSFWKRDKYAEGESLRLNISSERKGILTRCVKVLTYLIKIDDPLYKNQLLFKQAFCREQLGHFQDALGTYSDLIAQQVNDLDLTFVILKASILLMHIGGNNTQTIEYLEFLLEDPPESEGYTLTHIHALLAAMYEQSGDHYSVVVEQTYAKLQESYSKDLEKGKKPVTNQKKMQSMLTKKAFPRSSEVWEMLSLQALDRCEYVLALELMKKAAEKSPSKGTIFHLLAELHHIVGETRLCMKAAERAFTLTPQNADLMNLLLQLNPDKWQDRIRTVAPTKEEVDHEIDEDDGSPGAHHRRIKKAATGEATSESATASAWLLRLATKTTEAFKDGLMTVANAKAIAVEKAQAAAEKEKRRKERQAKRAAAAAAAEGGAEGAGVAKTKPRKKRDPAVDGPAKPERPPDLSVARNIMETIRSENKNVHIYDPVLRQYAAIQETVKKEENELLERKKKRLGKVK